MNIAVTGGAGFIGSHIVERLVERGDNVIVIDNLITGKKDNLKKVWNKIDFLEIDIRNFDELKVNLKEGNVLNSVKFKLLLPVTRNNLHEILGSIILKELGFISPETFQVKVDINGTNGLMLFQEDSQKELLEKNLHKPLTEVPDPFEKYNSFGEHNNEMLKKLSNIINEKEFMGTFRYALMITLAPLHLIIVSILLGTLLGKSIGLAVAAIGIILPLITLRIR